MPEIRQEQLSASQSDARSCAGENRSAFQVTDVTVGENLKIVRRLRKKTQKDIADLLQLTPQQYQKFEAGLSRLTAPRLAAIASYLEVNIKVFFEPPALTLGSIIARHNDASTDGRPIVNDQDIDLFIRLINLPDEKKAALMRLLT
jgi:transcriptional regulator with XRE-family HTH domain